MIKIIFISGTPISKIVGDKIDPYWYQNHGFEVEYWGMQNIYYDSDSIDAYFSGNRDFKYKFPNETVLNSKKEVTQALKDFDDNCIICFIDFGMQFDFWILLLFKKYNIPYYIGPRSTTIQVPPVNNKNNKNRIESLYKKILKKNFINRVYQKLLYFVFIYTNYYQHPTHVFSCGTRGRSTYAKLCTKAIYISIPSVDISWEKNDNIIHNKYCVYVENNFHFSPDVSLMKTITDNTDIGLYEKNICSMFDLIENELDVKIIISASGKYKYPDENIFGNREVVYYKTNQLIQHSEFVIGHFSQGISQAIVSLKPLMLIQDDSFSLDIKNAIEGVAKIFKIETINTKDITPDLIKQQFVIDRRQYQSLKHEYYSEKGVETDSKEWISNALNSYMAYPNI